MHFERVTGENHPLYPKAVTLYGVSFPPHEQREGESQKRILEDPAYHFTLIRDGDDFVGEILYWETETFLYVEHFCIEPDKRGRRYGQRALSLLGRQGKTVILEIDPPVDEISIRRKGFYERCGFTANPWPHIHPPYHRGNRGHGLVVMSCPQPITESAYDAFSAYLNTHVMADVF